MQAKAIARTVRIAPRKVRLVVDLIRGKKLSEAAAILRLTPKASSVVVEKVLKSAAANAVNNYDMDQDTLFVKEAYVNEGPTLKRYQPRAKGSAGSILKRTSHITIVLEERK
ncbi:MAG TPA: 50S ribosomal protein L22 [Acholeplasmataceae bacterium]|jgi:large subunit ribosomal protein L22|nr:50S ribosomal protein L22 [Acholeplasmataceae bacterium]